MRIPTKATIIFDYGNEVKDWTFDLQELYDIINELEKRNKNLKEDFKRHIDRINELTNRIDKAIEHLELFIGDCQLSKYDTLKILTYTRDILKGSDKEW